MKNFNIHSLFLLLLLAFACTPKTKTAISGFGDDGKIEVRILHINDVYEIAPLEGGKVGGMARFAALQKQLLQENPNLLTVHAGDFLNPSLIGTMKHNNEKIKGKQMVEVMNKCNIDLVTFGNHEFDLKMPELQKRLNESTFEWLGTCVRQNVNGGQEKFYKERNGAKEFVHDKITYQFKDADGTTIKIGLFGTTLDSNPKDYVTYLDWKKMAQENYDLLKDSVDVVVGLTHLEVEDDLKLAAQIPGIPLLMGGHDHHNMMHKVRHTSVAKADANVKSAYVHTIYHDKKTKYTYVKSKLIAINEKIQEDPEVKAIVDKWQTIMEDNMKKIIAKPNEILFNADPPLDGRESINRNQQSNLGQLICKSIAAAAKKNPDCSFINSGSIRIDDQISGNVTPVDVFRALPFGGAVIECDIKGDLLRQVLDEGKSKKGKGAYLQLFNIAFDESANGWKINGEAIDIKRNYHVMTTGFLMKGLDIKVLKSDSPGMSNVSVPAEYDADDPRRDIRIAMIEYMKSL